MQKLCIFEVYSFIISQTFFSDQVRLSLLPLAPEQVWPFNNVAITVTHVLNEAIQSIRKESLSCEVK